MLEFKQMEFVYECKPDKLIVVETSLDGSFDFNIGARRTASEFPLIVEDYRMKCMRQQIDRGVPVFYNSGKYDLVFLPIVQVSYGFSKDQPHQILTAMTYAIDSLAEDAGAANLASGMVCEWSSYGGKIPGHFVLLSKIKKSKLQWTIYKE